MAQNILQKTLTKPDSKIATPKQAGALFTVTSLQTRKKWLKALIYGAHGIGKTEFLGTAADVPDMCEVFMINAEKGDMTIEETDRIKNKAGIFLANCDSSQPIEQIENMRKWLKAHCVYRDANNGLGDEARLLELESRVGMPPAEDGKARRFRTVGVDTLTEIQAFAFYQTLGVNAEMALTADIPDTEWSHHNKILAKMQVLMRALRDLPMHVIFLCQEDYKQDETKKFNYNPMLTGQMAKRVQGFVDLCGFLVVTQGEKGQDVRRLFIQPVGKFNAKNRIAGYKKPYIDDPHMARIAPLIGLDKQHPAQLQASPTEPPESGTSDNAQAENDFSEAGD